MKLTGEVAYVYLYFWPPIPYKLCAIDRRSSKVIWSSLVWAAGGMKTYTGQGWHQAELTLTSGNITVFGVAGDTAYVEMFDRKTGKNIVRFSTSYFNLVEGTSDK